MAAVIEKFYGMTLVNADAKAIGRVVRKAVATKSTFLVCVAIALALVKIAQEMSALSFNYRASLQTTGADAQDDDTLAALGEGAVEGAPEDLGDLAA